MDPRPDARRPGHRVRAPHHAASRTIDLAIRGGLVVAPDGERRADLAITGEQISAIGDVGPADREIDARGKLVLPGCVDLHTHLASTPTFEPLDDFEHGTRAAIAGGVTTVVSMVYQEDGSLQRGIARGMRDAARSIADFAFHVVVTDPSGAARGEIPALVDDGYAGLKVFMVSPRFVERRDDYRLLLQAAADAGALVAMHAEDHAIVAARTAELHASGRTGVEHFPASRPVEAEAKAVADAIELARSTEAAVYLVHLSSRAALDALRAGKRAARVFGETRPLYLYLTRSQFDRPDAALWVGQPPLREHDDVDAVWAALADGTLDTVGTDHVPHTRAAKLAPGLSFDRIPPGVSNLETLLPMLYSEGVHKGRLALARLVDVLATAPARIAGMYPRKGVLAVGSDADIVIFDPNARRTIRAAELHSACDYDPYEGWDVVGWPEIVISRGETVFDRGEVRARSGRGRLIPRAAFAHA
ncbi:MAG: dihydropyrimidinase [Chloroflexi bacterium]|nr:MAG: dihydropyrimidinase [Chloroflexota bacterium]